MHDKCSDDCNRFAADVRFGADVRFEADVRLTSRSHAYSREATPIHPNETRDDLNDAVHATTWSRWGFVNVAVFGVLVVFAKETKLCESVNGVFFSSLERYMYSVDTAMRVVP